MGISLAQVWAKTEPFQSVLTHGLVSGITAQELLKSLLSCGSAEDLASALGCTLEELENITGYIASVHDEGKIEPNFQAGAPEMAGLLEKCGLMPDIPAPVRHEQTSHCILTRIWTQHGLSSGARIFYAGIVRAHHQGRFGEPGRTSAPEWVNLQNEFELTMRRTFLKSEALHLPAPQKQSKGAAGALLLGLVILADWIASGETFADAESWIASSGKDEVRRRARAFIESSGLAACTDRLGESFTDIWTAIPRAGMRELQIQAEDVFKSCDERIAAVLIEAPMGEGKTEAGIYAALKMGEQWGKGGFYVALPTAATANQMVGRVRALLEQHSVDSKVRLLHSTSWLTDGGAGVNSEEAGYAASWLQPARRGLLANYAVGTVDQAMMSVLKVKYGVLRLLGLAEKSLVIDELHSYDVYMSDILNLLLRWCRALEIPVVMLSATLPPDKKRQMMSAYTSEEIPQAYPSITTISETGRVSVHRIGASAKSWVLKVDTLPVLNDAGAIASAALEAVSDGGCLCVLMNTVNDAQRVYSEIKKSGFDGLAMLFHARFTTRRRDEIERECIKLFGKDKSNRPRKAILVATQVAEQSLDLDFDAMFSAVAPIDLLLQRAGRIFRHEDTPRPDKLNEPKLTVLVPDDGGEYGASEYVYPACLLNSSLRLISGRQEIAIPDDMPALVEAGYSPALADPREFELWAEHLMEEEVKAASDVQYKISTPDKGFDPVKSSDELRFDDLESSSYLSAKTRLGEPSVRVVLLPEPEFEKYARRAVKREGALVLSDVGRIDAKELMLSSVSIRLKLLGEVPPGECLDGRGILSGLKIYVAGTDETGRLCRVFSDGRRMVIDNELGAIFEKGEKDAREL